MLRNLPLDAVPGWLDAMGIEDGVPFLIPRWPLRRRPELILLRNPAPENTQAAIAYDLASFPTFLWCNREPLGTRSWRDARAEDRDARPEDRDAYHSWRRIDERGRGVKGSTWGREVSTVIRIISGRSLPEWSSRIPIPQRDTHRRRGHRRADPGSTPAEAPKDGHREDLAWLPPAAYRRWAVPPPATRRPRATPGTRARDRAA
jgi:hypothetical protein